MEILTIQLKNLGIDLEMMLKSASIEAMDEDNHNLLLWNFRNIWADNGDELSNQYTGTGSTHASVSRSGKMDISGMLDQGKKSLMRFYIQNFSDNEK